jgi:signal transduction histidine kinase
MTEDTIRADVILVVDDTPSNLQQLFAILQSNGFTVLVTQDGLSALAKAENAEPDLILLDILMPGIDGLEVCRKLKANKKTKDIPIIFMTALTDTDNKVKGFSNGGVDYITKPIEEEELIARIKTHLILRKIRQQLQTQNQELQQEISVCQGTELKLKKSQQILEKVNEQLEARVAERTTELVQAKQKLEMINAELIHSNHELEQFAYIVSHDLQAPLRSINMFADLLAQECQSNLNGEANQYLRYIIDGATRMQTLIQDLLVYCRAGKNEQTWILIDLKEIVQQVIQDLQETIKANKALIRVKNLPIVQVNPTEINQLFQNLITNGLKFRSQAQPEIVIDAKLVEQQWLISVQDNGIGIESEYQNKIFQVFQRLHTQDKYPGTGIGLAICQKILQRYGGKIWVKSELGKGSTFYFTLPVKNSLMIKSCCQSDIN